MENLPLEIVNIIIRFIEYPKLPFRLSWDIKKNKIYDQEFDMEIKNRQINFYDEKSNRIDKIEFTDDSFSEEHKQILLKKLMLIELVCRNFDISGWKLDMIYLDRPYLQIWYFEFYRRFEELYREGLTEFNFSENIYNVYCETKIGGLNFHILFE